MVQEKNLNSIDIRLRNISGKNWRRQVTVRNVGPWKLVSTIKLLSAGAFGDVYLVYDLKKKTRVIFKTELRTVSIISMNQSINSTIILPMYF